ncbi:tRNA modification GTPase [Mariprofundus micogutta]|uniref:tRNA modification GTPase MnmE n=1 Tax=Mariprofundus micogutta TaxID=1921010 RepID=A0A1L8CQ84_9PROT|nr:tRNA modification GTPase [Mariprofundus micogutta]
MGVIRISGPRALRVLEGISASNREMQPRVAQLSSWLDEAGDLLDQGLSLYFPGPNSYTGEDVVELQGHGGPVLLRALLDRVFQLGCRAAEPGEFTRRAVENGKIDLSQAEAVAACIDAATVRAGKQAQRQLQGAFGQYIDELMHTLTSLVAHVEASLDFPEEEIPALFFDQLASRMQNEVIQPVDNLLATAQLGERLFDGATVAIVGAPNVGKSSLLNMLSGRDRAIVSDIPGTTRDVLEIDFEVHGIPVRLVDTAGLRQSDDVIEQEGVRRAHQAAHQADVTIFMADASRSDTWTPSVHADVSLMNKIDLEHGDIPEHFLSLCAKTGQGLELLRDRLASQLGDINLADEGLLVTRERHRVILLDANNHLKAGLLSLGDEDKLELTAMEWRRAWALLGSILGIGDVEHILDHVFSEFCIGK